MEQRKRTLKEKEEQFEELIKKVKI